MNLQVYADSVNVEGDGDGQVTVYMSNVDTETLMGQVADEVKLDSIEMSTIVEYISSKQEG